VLVVEWAIWGPVTVLRQGRKITASKHLWLTMVSTLLYPQLLGRPVIKSMATVPQKTFQMF